MKTHAEAKTNVPARHAHTMPMPNALAHQAQLRGALLRAGVQPRLKIGAVNDPLEREADAVAERVLRMPEPEATSVVGTVSLKPSLQQIQAKASSAPTGVPASPHLESSLNSLNNGGTPLDTSTRTFFEPRFGQDFSQVRLHTDDSAAQMADSLSAKAFTLGSNIAFAANQYSADTSTGKNLLGHELAHVIQQRGVLRTKIIQKQNTDTAQQSVSGTGTQQNSGTPTEPSENLITFIADYERFRATPYRGQDDQNRTIGYGHVIRSDDGTEYDNGITEEDARRLLRDDIQGCVGIVNSFVRTNEIVLNQQQYDALISLTFNGGVHWRTDSGIGVALRNADFSEVGRAIRTWRITAGGRPSLGVERRRSDEAQMFDDGDYVRDYPDQATLHSNRNLVPQPESGPELDGPLELPSRFENRTDTERHSERYVGMLGDFRLRFSGPSQPLNLEPVRRNTLNDQLRESLRLGTMDFWQQLNSGKSGMPQGSEFPKALKNIKSPLDFSFQIGGKKLRVKINPSPKTILIIDLTGLLCPLF